MKNSDVQIAPITWQDKNGKHIECREKRKALDEGLLELAVCYRDIMEDALLLGCGEAFFREAAQTCLQGTPSRLKERQP